MSRYSLGCGAFQGHPSKEGNGTAGPFGLQESCENDADIPSRHLGLGPGERWSFSRHLSGQRSRGGMSAEHSLSSSNNGPGNFVSLENLNECSEQPNDGLGEQSQTGSFEA